jgi:hypothetical protein
MSYADDRLSAADSLAEDGQVVTLTYVGTASYNPATGGTTNTAPGPETVSAAIFPLSAIRYAFHKEAGSNIVEGDQQCLLAALNTAGVPITAPQVNGTITDTNGKVWTIITADPLSPAGVDLMHDCTVRRA